MAKKGTFTKVFLILGAILLVAGLAVFIAGMSAAGWDFSRLSTVRYDVRTFEAAGEVTSLRVEYGSAAIRVEFSEEADAVRIDYPVRQNERGEDTAEVTISEEAGALTVTEHTDWEDSIFQWDIDLDFGQENIVHIVLPAGAAYSLDLYTAIGSVTVEGEGAFTSLSLRSDNGSVSASGAAVAGDASLRTSNGSVRAENVNAGGTLILSSSNGSVRAAGVSAADIEAKTGSGSVTVAGAEAEGTLAAESAQGSISLGSVRAGAVRASSSLGEVSLTDGVLDALEISLSTELGGITCEGGLFAGAQSDYSVQVSTGMGSANIANSAGGSRTLILRTNMGDIDVAFER